MEVKTEENPTEGNNIADESTNTNENVKVVTSKTKKEVGSLRSWLYLITFPCTSLITWGIISAFPVLFVAFLEKFQRSRSETSTIGSLQVGLLYMLAIIPGHLIPIYGFRVNLIIGCFIMVTGLISSIFVKKIYLLYISMGVITCYILLS